MGYNSFCTLYDSYVIPVANYAAGVWGYDDHQAPRVLQNKINRYYLGVHRFAAVSATALEMNITNIRYARWVDMLRLHDRIMSLPEYRIPKVVYRDNVKKKEVGWVCDIRQICTQLHLPQPSTGILHDLDNVYSAVHNLSLKGWREDMKTKSKLETYCDITEGEGYTGMVKANLRRGPRSLLSKLLTGTLPLEVEVGRWTRTDKKDRICKVCETSNTEDEYHFLFVCSPLESVRDPFHERFITDKETFKAMSNGAKVRFLMREVGMKEMGDYLTDMFAKRKEILYRPNLG